MKHKLKKTSLIMLSAAFAVSGMPAFVGTGGLLENMAVVANAAETGYEITLSFDGKSTKFHADELPYTLDEWGEKENLKNWWNDNFGIKADPDLPDDEESDDDEWYYEDPSNWYKHFENFDSDGDIEITESTTSIGFSFSFNNITYHGDFIVAIDNLSKKDISDAVLTVDTKNKDVVLKMGDTVVDESEYDVKYGKSINDASESYPTSKGRYYAFAVAKSDSQNYRGSAKSESFIILDGSTTRYAPYNINATHGNGAYPDLFFYGDTIEGNSSDYVTIYLDDKLVIEDKGGAYTIPVLCERVSDGYKEETHGHHEYIFYLKSLPISISEASVEMKENSADVASVTYNGYTLENAKDYTVTYKNVKGVTIDKPTTGGEYRVVFEGIGSFNGTVEKTFVLAEKSSYNDDSGIHTVYKNGAVNVSSLKEGDYILKGTTIYCDKLPSNGENWFIYNPDGSIDVELSTETETETDDFLQERYETTDNFKILSVDYGKIKVDTNAVCIEKKVDEKEAKCTESGNSEYYIGFDGKYYALDEEDYKEIEKDSWVIPSKGHTYGEPKWVWSSDYSSATAEFECSECGHTEKVDAEDITVEKIDPTYDAQGVVYYTASVLFDDKNFEDTKKVDIDALVRTDISSAEISFANGNTLTANGSEQKIAYTLTVGDKVLTEGTDYEVYEGDTSAKDPGTYIIKIRSKGDDMTGETEVVWYIVPGAVKITMDGNDVTESYEYGESLTLTAPEAESGKKFSHWEVNGKPVSYSDEYSFIVKENTDLVPVYVEEEVVVEKEPVLSLKASQAKYNGKNALGFTFTHSIPDNYEISEIGLLYSTNKLAGYTSGAKVDLTKTDFDVENAVKNNTTGKIRKFLANYTNNDGNVSLSYAVGTYTDVYVYAVGYIKCTDPNSNEITLYTDLGAFTYDSIG